MSDFLPPTPNLGLILPVPGADYNMWGITVNTAFELIDTLIGGPVNLNRIDINGNVIFNGNAATDMSYLGLVSNPSTLVGSNLISDINGNLFFNNASGFPVQITLGNTLNTGALLTNIWTTDNVSGSHSIHAADGYTRYLCDTTSFVCTLNLPTANSVSTGTYYYITDAKGHASTHNIVIVPSGSDTVDGYNSNFSIISDFASMFVVSNGVNGWSANFAYANAINTLSVTTLSATVTTLSATTLGISGNTILSGTLTAVGTITAENNLDVGGNITTIGNLGIGGNITGAPIFTGAPTFTGVPIFDDGIIVNGTIGAQTANAVGFTNFSFATGITTGTYTIPSTTYNNPLLIINTSTIMTGDLTIIFPHIDGFWLFDITNINVNGHTLTIQQATSGANQTYTSNARTIVVATTSSGTIHCSTT
jgi:hypothetical protein